MLLATVAIVFAECGLLIGFFLPGDSLLFTVGLLITTGVIDHSLWLACLVLTLAGFAGNVVGYSTMLNTCMRVAEKERARLIMSWSMARMADNTLMSTGKNTIRMATRILGYMV